MAEQFDPYLKWLGIRPKDQPPHHYRLLAIDLYEDDPDIIENAADQRVAHVRTFASGKHAQQSQQLLNQITSAKLVLLSPEKKSAYDAALNQRLAPAKPVAQRLPVAQPLSEAPSRRPPVSRPAPVQVAPAAAPQEKPIWQNPFILGAVAVGLLLVVGGMVVAFSGRGEPLEIAKEETPADARVPSDSKPHSPEVPSTGATGQADSPIIAPPSRSEVPVSPVSQPAKPFEPPQPATRPIELLKVLDLKRDTVAGQWNFENGILSCASGQRASLRLHSDIPTEYQLEVVVSRVGRPQGGSAFSVGLVAGDHQFRCVHGKKGPASWNNLRTFLSNVDGNGAGEKISGRREERINETDQGWLKTFESERPSTITHVVTKQGVTVSLNGKVVIDWKDSPDRLSLGNAAHLPKDRCLFLSGEVNGYRIYKVTLTPLGNNASSESVSPAPSNPPKPDATLTAPVDLIKWIDPEKHSTKGTWRVERGELIVPSDDYAKLMVPADVPEEYDLHLTVEPVSGAEIFGVGLVVGNSQVFLILRPGTARFPTSGLHMIDGVGIDINKDCYRGRLISNGAAFQLAVSVRKNRVVATCDGKTFVDWKGDFQRLSLGRGWDVPESDRLFVGSFQSVHRIKKFELVPAEGAIDHVVTANPPAKTLPSKPKKLPLPSTAASEKSLRQLRDLFGNEIAAAESSQEKSLVAKKLYALAAKSVNNSSDRFALLKETRRLATLAGDAETALLAADDLADAFEVEALNTKVETVVALVKTAKFTAQKKPLAEKTLAVADEAAGADQYDTASELLEIALTAARPVRDRELTKKIVARRKEIQSLAEAYSKVEDALATLENTPEDPNANAIAGRFWCLVKNDWQRGLPMLAKGSDAQLQELAKSDLANPTETDEQVALGNAWWEIATDLRGEQSTNAKLHAADWYDLASLKLKGLNKRRIVGRLKEIQSDRVRWKFLGVRNYCSDGVGDVPLGDSRIPDELVGRCDGFQGTVQGPCKVDHKSIGPAIRGWFGKAFLWSVAYPEAIDATIRTTSRKFSKGNDHGPTLKIAIHDEHGKILLWDGETILKESSDYPLSYDAATKTLRIRTKTAKLSSSSSTLQISFGVSVRHPGDHADTSISVVPSR